jgi:hypothetical protein
MRVFLIIKRLLHSQYAIWVLFGIAFKASLLPNVIKTQAKELTWLRSFLVFILCFLNKMAAFPSSCHTVKNPK